jgi:acylphosphatase
MQSVRVIITGRVQGVGYRAWTVRTASQLGLKGWVRNLSSGSVEAVFSGDSAKVESMLEACQEGPFMARVDNVQAFPYDEMIPEDSFTAKPTL